MPTLQAGQNDQATELRKLVATGETWANRGRFDNARAICDQIFAIDPGNLGGLLIYFSATRIAAGDPVHKRVELFLNATVIPDRFRASLFFMHGKALDDMGRTAEAFDAFITANALRENVFNPEGTRRLARRMIDAMPAKIAALPRAEPRMVFVLGMPRSGTSLMSQMLGAHPRIHTMGERTSLGTALTGIKGHSISPLEAITRLSPQTLARARQDYIADLPKTAHAAIQARKVLVDKMPENYWLAFAIPLMFPDSVIVQMRRPRLATCWSCFRNDFRAGHPYATSFHNLLTQYDIQSELCTAWASGCAPGQWRDVLLDQLTHDPMAELLPILKKLDLDWDPACLSPETAGGSVATLSKWQIRQGIDPKIARGWERYLPMITQEWGVAE